MSKERREYFILEPKLNDHDPEKQNIFKGVLVETSARQGQPSGEGGFVLGFTYHLMTFLTFGWVGGS